MNRNLKRWMRGCARPIESEKQRQSQSRSSKLWFEPAFTLALRFSIPVKNHGRFQVTKRELVVVTTLRDLDEDAVVARMNLVGDNRRAHKKARLLRLIACGII